MSITINDINAGPAPLENKLSPHLREIMPKPDRLQLLERLITEISAKASKVKLAAMDYFCLGHLSQQAAKLTENDQERSHKQEAALKHYEQVISQLKTGEPAFYAQYSLGVLAQNLEYPWSKVEEALLGAFQTLPERGEPILRIIHFYQAKHQWPTAYLFSKFAKEQFHGKMPAAKNWGLDKSLYRWRILDVHKVSCYYLKKIDEATAAYSTLCRLIAEDPASFLAEDISRIYTQKFLFPGYILYEKNSAQYHYQ